MRVLIVDDDQARRAAVQRSLARARVQTAYAASADEAIRKLQTELFDAVVCDLRTGRSGAPRVVQWVGSCAPSIRVLVLAAAVDRDFRERLASAAEVRVLERPDDHDAMVQMVLGFGPRRGFFGNSIEVELFDYVQMIALTGRDKLVEVDTVRGTGRIWFEHGDIVHAEYDQYRGELAFYKMLSVGRGSFRESMRTEPPKRTVTRSSTHLLMEAARQTDEGTLGQTVVVDEDEETSFGGLMDEPASGEAEAAPPRGRLSARSSSPPPPPPADGGLSRGSSLPPLRPRASENEDEDFAALVSDAIELEAVEPRDARSDDFALADSRASMPARPPDAADSTASLATPGGHAVFEDPEMRAAMLDQFWQFEGINGVAIISSTGKVLAEDMRSNSSLVTLAGFYMRGAARIARTLGYNVFDGVVARSVNGQQMVMVSMGAASAVLSVESSADPEAVRDAVMGVE